MKIFKSINKLNKQVNFKANIGFVPTMGALHKGHMSLIDSSKKKCNKTLVTIFVNPSQFNKKSDYIKYPKILSNDLKILRKKKVDYVFIPQINEIYKNKKNMKISINSKDKIMCAKFRKGHFEGVLAVINQLLGIIRAKYMFLGIKDYQQLYLIRKFIKNKFDTKIIACKTIRDKNHLAYSSRNLLLSKNDLIKASKVIKKIKFIYYKIKKNINNSKKINDIKNEISNSDIKIEYLQIRNKYNLSKKYNKYNFKIFIAFYINKVRLIDNF
tara:strand:- start:66 stop:875 length:810 start_codon:yes stop_codon:yes gene_type:complete